MISYFQVQHDSFHKHHKHLLYFNIFVFMLRTTLRFLLTSQPDKNIIRQSSYLLMDLSSWFSLLETTAGHFSNVCESQLSSVWFFFRNQWSKCSTKRFTGSKALDWMQRCHVLSQLNLTTKTGFKQQSQFTFIYAFHEQCTSWRA